MAEVADVPRIADILMSSKNAGVYLDRRDELSVCGLELPPTITDLADALSLTELGEKDAELNLIFAGQYLFDIGNMILSSVRTFRAQSGS